MNKTYNPKEIEQSTYQRWEESGCFKPKAGKLSYCIVFPPPNVTGNLHMGHGFQTTLMDALVRYHRMMGDNTLWQVGTDHAGIATQMVVENQLKKDGQTRHDLGRDKFIERTFEWKEEYGGNITQQLRRLGASMDWSRERFTMDEHLTDTVKKVFTQFYDEGLIYRGKRLVNWDPHFKTALSDLEVVSEEEQGHLWHIRYPLSDGSGELIVATTRPETMLGDTAVAVHPDDARYKNFIGKTIRLPLTKRDIPIIADDYVDIAFGTGCVKITPAHDFNDYDMGQRHQLPLINILTDDAKINDEAPEAYRGLDRFDARKKIVADLKTAGLLEKIDKHTLKVPRNDRGNNIVEPYLTDQWYVSMEGLAKPAINAVKNGETNFIPENWSKTYYQWLDNIQDWCISRQLWWGHRIPAWYDDAGNIYVAESEAAARKKHQLADDIALRQDEDVLDTWFSAGLWPFATLGWPEKTPELQAFYPTNVLVTGFDIIFFWVARMMMMGLKLTDKVPFKEIYITGLIRDAQGKKMSKSKGNVLDPIDLIDGVDIETLVKKRTHNLMQESQREKVAKATRKEFPDGIEPHGTDALRFTYCALASTGRDIRFDVGRLGGYRNFCNKLWNASRFVLMQVENETQVSTPSEFNSCDQWILTRLQDVISKTHEHFTHYRFDLLSKLLYEFVWQDYCDWYVELTKPILNGDCDNKAATRYTLVFVLETILRLLHPLTPFITETIWKNIASLLNKTGETIMLEAYPQTDPSQQFPEAHDDIEWVKNIINAIRNIRGEMNIKPSKKLKVMLYQANKTDEARMERLQHYISNLARLEKLTWTDTKEGNNATALVGDLEILISMEDLIDKAEETKRLNKEITKQEAELARVEGKLNNASFTDKAPEAVVAKEKARLNEINASLEKLKDQLAKL